MPTDFIDIYCERLGPGFWSEPINALSNIAFIIAAFFAWRLSHVHGRAVDTVILIGLLAVIGMGSFAFHTLATPVAMMADVMPILFYQIAFITLYARRVMALSWVKTGRLLFIFLAACVLVERAPPVLPNGSTGYMPAFIFLGAFAIYHFIMHKKERFILAAATLVFAVSLTIRSVDMAVCPMVPFGVHYGWHILNAIVLYLTTRAYILNRR